MHCNVKSFIRCRCCKIPSAVAGVVSRDSLRDIETVVCFTVGAPHEAVWMMLRLPAIYTGKFLVILEEFRLHPVIHGRCRENSSIDVSRVPSYLKWHRRIVIEVITSDELFDRSFQD